jgi:hypothetical protein
MSKGGFTPSQLLSAVSSARYADNKKPISGSTGDGFFWNSFSDQIRNSFPKAHSLLEAPPPDFADAIGIHRAASIAVDPALRQG